MADEAFQAAYEELRAAAGAMMRGERPEHTLRPTALVHEAYLRIAGKIPADCQDEKDFIRLTIRAMRQVLIDHARKRGAVKRGGGWEKVTLDGIAAEGTDIDLIDLDRALQRLEAADARLAQVVELRVFGGLTMEDVGKLCGVTRRTAHTRWNAAREWLARELGDGGG